MFFASQFLVCFFLSGEGTVPMFSSPCPWWSHAAGRSINPFFSKMIQHFPRVSDDKTESGCRMILMEAKENPGDEIPRQSCGGCQRGNSRCFPKTRPELGKMHGEVPLVNALRSESGHASDRTDEQCCLQITFQPADAAGYRRLQKMKTAAVLGKYGKPKGL
jgi:hypothetical protein